MKLSVITDEITQDFETALDVMREYGVTGAELRGLWGTNIADLDADQVARAQRALQAREMRVCCLATPFYKCELQTDDAVAEGPMHLARPRGQGEQLEMLRRCCALAHRFDTDLLRVFAFWRHGAPTPSIERQIVGAFAEPVRIAAEEGITLVLENEHACAIGTGAEAARIVSAVDSPHLRVCWDPGNAFWLDEVPYPNGYEAVRPYLAHVHVKDAVAIKDTSQEVGDKAFRWCVIGEGAIDLPGQFDALRRDGYTGYISLETHYTPAGGTPEDGSRACLAALRLHIKD